ncbi:MAG: hypothetical protein LBU16_10435 [Treponema sp.]|jgi:hypothetical protein|nr:hypothetical protein [Treponema sp.]
MNRQEIKDLLADIADASHFINSDIFSILPDKLSTIKTMLESKNIKYEDFGGNDIDIDREFYQESGVAVYTDADDFFRNYAETSGGVIILGNKNSESVVSCISGGDIIFQQYRSKKTDKIITNFFYLKRITSFLSRPEIADYKDTAHDCYFFLSPESGKIKIEENGLENLVAIAKSDICLMEIYKKADGLNTYQKGWEFILKSKIIKGLEDIDVAAEGFRELVTHLDLFIDATIRDFELFLNSRSHETLVEQFENEKYVFADKIRSVLQGISGSLFSIAITFAGTVIAIRDVSDTWLINTIFTAMAILIVFFIWINLCLWGDLNTLKSEMNMKIKVASMGLPRTAKGLREILKPFFGRIVSFKVLISFIIILFTLLFLFLVYQYGNAPKLKTIFI